MKDQYGRNIDYLRISLTDRCNLRCKYCMPDGICQTAHSEILTYEEILTVCQAALQLGISHFKVTGGEPLVRKNAISFLRDLKELAPSCTVTLTTNGTLLKPYIKELRELGIDGINISLDAAQEERFFAITGSYAFASVLESIHLCAACGIRTKINAVLLPGNEDQLLPLARLAEEMPVDVRLIELMPIGEGAVLPAFSPDKARKILLQKYPDLSPVPAEERRGYGPAHYEQSEKLLGRIGWIDAISHQFCDSCNRIRLTSTGLLKPCLCYGNGVDLRAILRKENPGNPNLIWDELLRALSDGIFQKPRAHCFQEHDGITEHRKMAEIGG